MRICLFSFALLLVLLASAGYSGDVSASSHIDRLVQGRLNELGIPASKQCSDAVFLRRVYLDVIGTMPTVSEAKAFLADSSPDKRRALVDELLSRSEFAEYWTLKWCDLLKVKAEFPSNLWPNGAQAYYVWIRDCLRENVPYDRFARELLTANGSNFRVPPVNFFRAFAEKNASNILESAALIFMGARTRNWTEDQRRGMAAYFAEVGYKNTLEWKEEIVFHDQNGKLVDPVTGQKLLPVPLNGQPVAIPAGADPRVAFVDWLLKPDNPWFARNIVNRVWYWLLGRGIIHEPDDIRPDNPAQNEALLAFLEKELRSHDYDLKHIYRIILNSDTYQLSAEPVPGNKADVSNFSHYLVRSLDAEVLIDAVCMITGTTEKYKSLIPEPFTYIPECKRAVELEDGSISSPFLELFGRPSRDTGYESERNNEPSTSQRLHMLNSTHIQNKIARGDGLRKGMRSTMTEKEVTQKLYLSILSRFPTEAEENRIREYVRAAKLDRKDALCDIAWALFNSKEFLYKH